jgi:hypothetical protein
VKKFNCCPKIYKNFFIPSRNDILPIFNDLSKDIVGIVINIDNLIDKIGFYVGERFRVDVLHSKSNTVPPGKMIVNGEYDQEKDERGRVSIQIILITYPTDEVYLWDQEDFDFAIKQIADSIIHELSHMHQARSRDFESICLDYEEFENEKQQARHYLGHYDEVDAYARNIASELIDSQSSKILKSPSHARLEDSVNLWAYMNTFDKDISNPVIRKLLKKIYKNLILTNH